MNDKEVVLEAVKQNWEAQEYASEELKGDKDVMIAVLLSAAKRDAPEGCSQYFIDNTRCVLEIIADLHETNTSLQQNNASLQQNNTQLEQALREAQGTKPPRKRQRRGEANFLTQQVTEASQRLVQVKQEKVEAEEGKASAEEAVEDEQDEKQDLALFIDKLQTKMERLKKVALAGGADPAEVERAVG